MAEVHHFGVRMTKQIKKIGCSNIKTLIESDKLIINDFNIIEEMSTFSKRGNSWQGAKEGCTDDLITCLVVFGWLSNQAYFKEMTNTAKQQLYVEQQNLIEQDMSHFGFVDDGTRL